MDGNKNRGKAIPHDEARKLLERIKDLDDKLRGSESELKLVREQLGYVVRLLELIYGIEVFAKEMADKQLAEMIMESLIDGPKNISQVTRDVREKKGRASRSLVARTLEDLRSRGVVDLVYEKQKRKVYALKRGHESADPRGGIRGRLACRGGKGQRLLPVHPLPCPRDRRGRTLQEPKRGLDTGRPQRSSLLLRKDSDAGPNGLEGRRAVGASRSTTTSEPLKSDRPSPA